MELDVRGTPYPPYVQSEEEKRRWDQSTLVAMVTSFRYSADGRIDNTWVWYATRWIYQDPAYATGTVEELAEMEASAVESGLISVGSRSL